MPFQTVATTVQGMIAQIAERTPEAPAILAPGHKSLTYQGLWNLATDVREQLASLGIRRGDRVAMLLQPSPEGVTAFLATAAIATAVPLNPAYKAQEWGQCMASCRARALVVAANLAQDARSIAEQLAIPVFELSILSGDEAGWFCLRPSATRGRSAGTTVSARYLPFASPDDLAMLLFTSGSTGRARCVPLTHQAVCVCSWKTAQMLELTSDDRCLNMLPLCHVLGLITAILVPMAAGGGVAVSSGFDPARFADWLDELQPSWYSAPPAMHQAILDHATQARHSFRRTSLRFRPFRVRAALASPHPWLGEGIGRAGRRGLRHDRSTPPYHERAPAA